MNINIDIPDDLHKKAKMKAIEKNLFLKEFIIQAIEDKVKLK
jgi:predicted HicB family RNase H-like nuclease